MQGAGLGGVTSEAAGREIDPEATPRHSAYVTSEPFGDEVIVFHLASKQYVLLHSFAAQLWRAVDGISSVARLAERSGDAETATATLAGLSELGLLEIVA